MHALERHPRLRAGHRGFTLVEVVLAIVLLGLVIAGLMSVIVRQLRFYSAASEIMEVRRSVQQLADILPGELRGLSPASGDIYAIASSSIDFRAAVGASVVCGIEAGARAVTIPSGAGAAQLGFTSWTSAPQAGDSMMVYDDSLRVWSRLALAAAPATGSRCDGFVSTAAGTLAASRLVLSDTLAPTVGPGAAIRFYRRAHYGLYQASDGRWYLGYYECLGARTPACGTIQPVSGPYLPSAPVGGGLTLSYFDSTGSPTGDPARVARVDIIARAASGRAIRMEGLGFGTYQDSLGVSVGIRNR